jgi:two-component system cell cycle response regulator
MASVSTGRSIPRSTRIFRNPDRLWRKVFQQIKETKTVEANILIVDDEAGIRLSMQEFVAVSGFTTFTAASAEEALALLKEHPIDVVITDIMLPGLDGLELTDIIKKDYDIDVIVLTGYSGDYSYEEAISKGASDLVFKPVRFEELLLRLKRVLKERKLTNERLQMLEKLKKLSITDGLTKLYNSRHFYNLLKGEVDRAARYGHPLSMLIMDIDHFKDYNDNYGHLEGDKVLVRLGQVIKLLLRKMDTAYRYGGEEFTVILPETDAEEALTVAERIRKAVKGIVFNPEPGEEAAVTISIGMTAYSPPEDLTAFIQRADKALYGSKTAGRDRVSVLPAPGRMTSANPNMS